MGILPGTSVKNLPAVQEICVWSLGQEDPMEKEMATHSLPKKSDGQKSLAGYSPRGRKSWTWLGNKTTTTTTPALLLQEFTFPPTVQDGSFLSCVAFLDGGFRDWSSLEVSVSSQSCWTIEEATARDRGNHNGWQALCFQPSANMQVTLWKMRSLEESKHWLHFTWATASWLALLYQFWGWFQK